MAVNWTKNQQRIIDFKDGNLLVAAGAGSGKTAVLTAHIVKRITDPESGVDLDTLLVVTYTNAAAAEMKERVRKNLEQMLEENPTDENLSRQIGLIPSANISTIHSFCLKLIREQFFRLDLDPGFRLGDTGELSLMRVDILDEIFEEAYNARDESFLELRDMYSGKEGDDRVTKLILDLYDYAQSYPDPDEWLEKSLTDDDGWLEGLFATLKKQVEDLVPKMGEAVHIAVSGHIPPSMIDVLQTGESDLVLLSKKGNLEELVLGLSEFSFIRKPPLKKQDKVDYPGCEESIEEAFLIRKKVGESIKKLAGKYAGYTPEQVKRQAEETKDLRAELVKLVREFDVRFSEKKRSLGICDFSDLEHMALNILYENGKPSDVADSYAYSFNEILVDEYQDCNLVQESILYAVSRDRFGEENRFMVGDVKQSIYGFRQARPDIFLEKYKSYSDDEGERLQKVELSDNFRSRSGVLSGINMMFSQIMTENLGGIAYDERAALRAGAAYPPKGDAPDVQLLLLDLSDPEMEEADDGDIGEDEDAIDTSGYNKFEHEARAVGSKIIELVNSQNPYMVYDRDLGELRPASFKDIVILMRSLSSTQENYLRVLKEMGIPVYVENESGYFSSIEVVDVLNFLRVLDNPLQDIPLVGVMRSAFFSFSPEELAGIRLTGVGKGDDRTFYSCLMAAREENQKVDRFLTVMEQYRRLSRFISIKELLTRILEETGYRYYVEALPGGKKRLGNLDMLVAKAKTYEETSYRGLFHFIRYIDRLKKYDYEMDVAAGSEDAIDAVRIMTIHKSKGLEFPIVFVSNMNGQFNDQDLKAPILLDSEYGIASDIRNAKYRYKAKSIKRAAIRERKHLSLLEEEMRVLYVAMTRAKELLIMTGAAKDLKTKLEGYAETAGASEDQLSFSVLSGAVCYLDWVVPAFLRARDKKKEGVIYGLKTLNKGELDFKSVYVYENESSEYEGLSEKLNGILSWTYPNEELSYVHAAMSVSEIKKAAYESEEIVNIVRTADSEEHEGPKQDKNTSKAKSSAGASSGTDRGTAYHRALELYHFEDYPEGGSDEERDGFVANEMERIAENHLLSEEDTDMINIKDMETFYETELAGRMCAAAKEGKLSKEKPFMMGVPVGEIYKDMRGRQENVLIRGIIDAYFEEDGELVIVDYKTDRVPRESGARILKRRYEIQLLYYKRALELATGKRVRQMYLYSFTLGKEIEILA